MMPTVPDAQTALADLFERRSLDGYLFFKEPERVLGELISHGDESMESDEFSVAESLYYDALILSKTSNKYFLTALIQNRLSRILTSQGNFVSARALLVESQNIYITIDDRRGQAVSLCNIGGIDATVGEFENAMNCLKEALTISEEISDDRLSIQIMVNIGRNYCEIDSYYNALHYFKEARLKSEKIGFEDAIATCLLNEGDTLLDLGSYWIPGS